MEAVNNFVAKQKYYRCKYFNITKLVKPENDCCIVSFDCRNLLRLMQAGSDGKIKTYFSSGLRTHAREASFCACGECWGVV